MSRRAAAAALVCGLLAACALAGPRPVPRATADEPRVFEDDLDARTLRLAVSRTEGVAPDTLAARTRMLRILDAVDDPAARAAAIERSFRVLRVTEPVRVTAYYEPELAARRAAGGAFRYALYGRPPDLDRVRPYPTRAAIDAGALARQGLEIAWTDDPLQLFALHVQGSGRLRLADGEIVRVAYAGTNGRPYRSIAPALAARGLLPPGPATWPEMRAALATLSPEDQAAVLATDERYTFFRVTCDEDPKGSLGVPLTPGRSIAADPRVVAPGAVAYVATGSVHRFVVAQDTGAAITGARVDLFLGAGPDAEARAGTMRDRGVLYVFEPR